MRTQCTDVFWIRLHLSTFDDPRWFVIEQLPEAEAVENIYTRLLMLAGKTNANGLLLLYDRVPYTTDTLSAVLRRKKAVIELALTILIKFNFIELIDDVYAVLDWDRLQFTDDLAKIAERREKDKTRQSIKRRSLKLLSAKTSADESTDNLQTSEPTDQKLDSKIKKYNNNIVDLDPAQILLQKTWPDIVTSDIAIAAVATALTNNGEDYVLENIKYVQKKAKDNPAKYLVDALSGDYASHQQKSSKKFIAVAERKQQAETEKRQREVEDEKLQRWQASPEGRLELERLRRNGFALPNPLSHMLANETSATILTSTALMEE